MEYSDPRPLLRGFPVEFVALGFLVEGPLHGYALRTRIANGLGPLWQVASSQLYQVMHRLEERDYVCRVAEESVGGPSRTIYQVTSEGKEQFWSWAQTPVSTMRNVRVEFAAKIYFLRRLKLDSVSSFIDQQLGALERVEQDILAGARQGSDDLVLNAAWREFQVATIRNFYRWLTAHKSQLSTSKEIE